MLLSDMTILYIISTTKMDGSTMSFLSVLEYVSKKGCNVSVVIPDDNNDFIRRLDNMNVKHFVVPVEADCWPGFFGLKRLVSYPYVFFRDYRKQIRSRRAVSRIVESFHPDIIHTNVSPIDVGYFASRKYGIPHIWHIREYCDKDFNLSLFPSKRSYRNKIKDSFSICITHDLQKYYGLCSSKNSYVIYNGVRSMDNKHYISEKQHYFLCASRVSEDKDQLRTIRVFAKFCKKHPDYKLVILGDGYDYYINWCKTLSKELDIENNVIFEGYQSDVDCYMKEATALLVASPSEGFGRMTAEAAFCGCLVIGYDAAGTREVLKETGGFLWNSDDEYYDSMEKVVKMNSEDYMEKALNAQKVATCLYSTESYVDNVYSVYEKALGLNRG